MNNDEKERIRRVITLLKLRRILAEAPQGRSPPRDRHGERIKAMARRMAA